MTSQSEDASTSLQSIEDIVSVIQEARKPADGPRVGGLFLNGSVDLDDIDTDMDLDDIETSGDFVCSM